MNIQIKVTYASGTVTEILIPWEEKALTAVTYQEDEDRGVETPAKTQEELDAEFCQHQQMHAPADYSPTDKRYVSVQDLISGRAVPTSHEIIGEKEEVKGKGRIGGVGERKERGVEEGKPEDEHELCLIPFDTQTIPYYIPPKTLKDFIAAYGIELVTREFAIAKAWLSTNQKKRKTHQGTGRFLNAWLSRAQSRRSEAPTLVQRFASEPKTGSLLQGLNDSQEGW